MVLLVLCNWNGRRLNVTWRKMVFWRSSAAYQRVLGEEGRAGGPWDKAGERTVFGGKVGWNVHAWFAVDDR